MERERRKLESWRLLWWGRLGIDSLAKMVGLQYQTELCFTFKEILNYKCIDELLFPLSLHL